MVDVHDDTLKAIQKAWKDPDRNLFSAFGEAVQAGTMKSGQTYPSAQVLVSLARPPLKMTGGVQIDYRKVSIIVRGSKEQVDEGLPLVLAAFHDSMSLELPSGDRCMGWRGTNGGVREEEQATHQGQDIWRGIVEAEVISVRSRNAE